MVLDVLGRDDDVAHDHLRHFGRGVGFGARFLDLDVVHIGLDLRRNQHAGIALAGAGLVAQVLRHLLPVAVLRRVLVVAQVTGDVACRRRRRVGDGRQLAQGNVARRRGRHAGPAGLDHGYRPLRDHGRLRLEGLGDPRAMIGLRMTRYAKGEDGGKGGSGIQKRLGHGVVHGCIDE